MTDESATNDNDAFETTVYYDSDADHAYIAGKTVAVLGYGSQGHAHALNLHDSGVDVVVGLREGSSSWEAAEDAGLTVATPREAAEQADVVSMLVPDTVQPAVWDDVKDVVEPGDTLQFAHGFNIHYGQIEPPEDVNVTMIAPKSPGHLVRRNYEREQGTPGLLAVHQDATGDAKEIALAYGQAIGCTRAGVVETTFREETETDLFEEAEVHYRAGEYEEALLGYQSFLKLYPESPLADVAETRVRDIHREVSSVMDRSGAPRPVFQKQGAGALPTARSERDAGSSSAPETSTKTDE